MDQVYAVSITRWPEEDDPQRRLVRPEGSVDLTQPRFLAGAVAAAVAWRTGNVALTVTVGMILVVVLQEL